MRIGLVIWSLLRIKGGIQRLGIDIAHAMRERGHECVLVYQDAEQAQSRSKPEPVYPVAPEIELLNLEMGNAASIGQARQRLQQSNLDVLCAMFSWNALRWFPALMNNTGIPLLISEHNDPYFIESERWNRYERLACMAGADEIHMLNSHFTASLPQFLHSRLTVIPNPAPGPQPVDWQREKSPRKTLLSVGRLVESSKQFSLLITAFAMLAQEFPDWDLCICGDGDALESYQQLVKKLNLTGRVFLPGKIDDISSYYASAHAFCLPSRYEGFGLVLTEAQSFALPAVGFAACSGVNEIIVHGKNGLLAPEMTAKSLASSLRLILKSAFSRKKMGEEGQKMLDRYAAARVFDAWEALFQKTAMHKNNTRLNVTDFSEEHKATTALHEMLLRSAPGAPLLAKYGVE